MVRIEIWTITKNTRTKIAKQTRTQVFTLRENTTLAGEISLTTKIQIGQDMYLSKNVCRPLLVEALFSIKHRAFSISTGWHLCNNILYTSHCNILRRPWFWVLNVSICVVHNENAFALFTLRSKQEMNSNPLKFMNTSNWLRWLLLKDLTMINDLWLKKLIYHRIQTPQFCTYCKIKALVHVHSSRSKFQIKRIVFATSCSEHVFLGL